MRYALAFAGDAQLDLKALEPWLQEELMDELEILADDVSLLSAPGPGGAAVYSFSRMASGVRYHVVLTPGRNDLGGTLTVLGIDLRDVPLSPGP